MRFKTEKGISGLGKEPFVCHTLTKRNSNATISSTGHGFEDICDSYVWCICKITAMWGIYSQNHKLKLYTTYLQAFKREIHLPRYMLLIPGWYNSFWWRMKDEGLNCTVKERERVLLSSLAAQNVEFRDEEADKNFTTSTGIVSFDSPMYIQWHALNTP